MREQPREVAKPGAGHLTMNPYGFYNTNNSVIVFDYPGLIFLINDQTRSKRLKKKIWFDVFRFCARKFESNWSWITPGMRWDILVFAQWSACNFHFYRDRQWILQIFSSIRAFAVPHVKVWVDLVVGIRVVFCGGFEFWNLRVFFCGGLNLSLNSILTCLYFTQQ